MAWDVKHLWENDAAKSRQAYLSILHIAKALVLNRLCAVVRRRIMVREIVF